MKHKITDYRSDTVTRPGTEMRKFMLDAEVGDDVYREDPTVAKLELMAADMFQMEAALFCPSGTMTNQIALALHTRPADEVICDALSHIYLYEGSGMAANSGLQPRLIVGDRGRINAEDVMSAINAEDVHKGRSSLVSLENTSNRGGGSCYDFKDIQAIKRVCEEHQMALHLDGARLFNALVSNKESPEKYGKVFDTISICLSKGLGAPVGSLLIGSEKHIHEARRIRKRMGGGMRQAGILAAGGIFALQNNIERLATDHQHAKILSVALENTPWVKNVMPVETNIVICTLNNETQASMVSDYLKRNDILVSAISAHQIRWVTHLDIHVGDVSRTLEVLKGMAEIEF